MLVRVCPSPLVPLASVPARSRSTMLPSSNVVAPKPDGCVSGRTAALSANEDAIAVVVKAIDRMRRRPEC